MKFYFCEIYALRRTDNKIKSTTTLTAIEGKL